MMKNRGWLLVLITVCLCLPKWNEAKADETKITLPTKKTPEEAYADILVLRAALDKRLNAGSAQLSGEALRGAKFAMSKQGEQLAEVVQLFIEEFPTHTNSIVAFEHGVYGTAISGLFDKRHSSELGDMADGIPSCLFEVGISEHTSVPLVRAKQLQLAAEIGFSTAAIAAIRFGPDSLNGINQFMVGARSDAGKRLAQTILENAASDDVSKGYARAVINRKFSVGEPLPLEFTAVDGRKVNLSTLRGKVVLVDFWATWCAPCMARLPELKSVHQKYQDKGFEVVGISSDTDKERLQKVIQERAIAWPNYWSEKGQTNEFAVACGVFAIPNYWLVDRKGVIREIGMTDEVEEKVKFLLGEVP